MFRSKMNRDVIFDQLKFLLVLRVTEVEFFSNQYQSFD